MPFTVGVAIIAPDPEIVPVLLPFTLPIPCVCETNPPVVEKTKPVAAVAPPVMFRPYSKYSVCVFVVPLIDVGESSTLPFLVKVPVECERVYDAE